MHKKNNFILFFLIATATLPLTLPQLNGKNLFITIGLFILIVLYPYYYPNTKKNKLTLIVNLMLLLTLVVMLYRGIGFEMLGGDKYGGFLYFSVLAPYFFIIYSQTIEINLRKFRKWIIIIFFFALFFSSLQMLSDIHLLKLPNFIMEGREVEARNIEANIGSIRIWFLSIVGVNLSYLILILRKSNYIKVKEILLFILALSLASLSGHRIAILTIGLVFLLALLFSDNSKQSKIKIIILAFITSILSLLIVIAFTQEVPEIIERSFSFIPGIKSYDAEGTTEWRIQLWSLAMYYELPNYLIIGKGLARSISEVSYVLADDTFLWAIDSLNYHNGPLVITIGFGLPWFLLFLVFNGKFSFMLRDFKKQLRYSSNSSNVLFNSFFVIYLTNLITYLFIYGDLTGTFVRLNLYVGILLIIMKNVENFSERNEKLFSKS